MTFIYSFYFQNRAVCEKNKKAKIDSQRAKCYKIKKEFYFIHLAYTKKTREPIRREDILRHIRVTSQNK